MAIAIRTQVDELNEQYSYLTALDCSNLPDMTRQEFKDESDVNKVLARYGVNTPMREPTYMSVDYNQDLQQALDAISTAQEAIRQLPDPLRAKYGSWDRLMTGLYDGTFKTDLAAQIAKDKAAVDKAANRVVASAPTTEPRD